MAKLTATRGSIQMDDGVYDATLLSIDDMEATPNSPNQNPWFKWTFHVFDSEEGQELTAASSQAFGPKAKARGWIEAILGKKIEPGEEIDTEALCPKDCQVVVKTDPEIGFPRIQDVMGVRRRPAAKKPVGPQDGVAI